MKRLFLALLALTLAVILLGCGQAKKGYQVGVGTVDITPEGSVAIAGNSQASMSSEVSFPLCAKAVVFALGEQKAAVITLDTLKYPTELAQEAMEAIGRETGVPAEHVMIVSSHTHSGPHYSTYDGLLTQKMVEAVQQAEKDLESVELKVATIQVDGVAHNRRLLVDGSAWNTWMVKLQQARYMYPAVGPMDPELQLLAAVTSEGTYKALLWNYACHANANNMGTVSADYPGRVQEYLNEQLGYTVTALFLPGACGDINPNNTIESIACPLGDGILEALKTAVPIQEESMRFSTTIVDIPTREDPVFADEEIRQKWPEQHASYESNFQNTLSGARESYPAYVCALQLGESFAMVSNPGELFCQYGLEIKEGSSYAFTMVVEQTNGALGYIPTLEDYTVGGYECWYGEHSNLSMQAGEMIRDASLKLLQSREGE